LLLAMDGGTGFSRWNDRVKFNLLGVSVAI